MQPHPDSPLSNSYLPKLVHYLSGNNDTLLHRMMGEGNHGKLDILGNISVINLTFKAVTQTPDEISHPMLYLQLLCFLYVLVGLTHLINEYLMPCLENLSLTFDLSQTSTGILVAIGISIPELTTNILSVFSNNVEMIGYGFGAIVGSGVFDFTLCFGITAVFSNYYHGIPISFKMKPLLRDIYIYLLTLVYLVIVFQDYQVGLMESLILTLMWPVYVLYSMISSKEDEPPIDPTTKVPFQMAYESFQLHRKNQYQSVDEESSDEELDHLVLQRKKHRKTPSQRLAQRFKSFAKKFVSPFSFVFKKTIPYQTSPIFAFLMIMVYIFLIVKYVTNSSDNRFTIETVDIFVGMMPISHTFVGLTMACWGGNISDIMNASIAAINKKTEFATSSIIGSQIINLQIALGLPWLLNNVIYGKPIVFQDGSIFTSIVVVFIVVVLSLGLMILNKLHLNYAMGMQLISVYVVYFIFEYYNSN